MNWSQDNIYLFNQGTYYRSYDNMGAHPLSEGGVSFSVWAPGARAVYVTGTFNDWCPDEYSLSPVESSGIWSGIIPDAKINDLYKYVIVTYDGDILHKADPYAFSAELRPGTASRIVDINGYSWNDDAWLKKRAATDHFKTPMNIYEVHLGSWRTSSTIVPGEPIPEGYSFDAQSSAGCEEGAEKIIFLNYRQIADQLVPYVTKMGYTHIELMPVAEHPFDGSWGYQVTGYYAPTSRFGTPKDLMYLIDKCHEAGIGVITDWVPGHFCRDAFGLGRFNGNMLYENKDHKEWGTYIFDLGRSEVRGFLISNAHYWLEKYHFDGIRVDGVTSMLYLNYGINDPSEKTYNVNGGEENLEAVKFLQSFNDMVGKYFPGVFTVAEESSAWPLVTYPPKEGGLGFHYKWNMGWMNDTLRYFSVDFPWRRDNHNLLTFSMMYAYSENYILPFSHDEVVHGKKSLIGRMPGGYNKQFAGLRLLAMYQICHPGSKLTFMGNEFGQFIEWRFYEGLEWFLLDYDLHKKHQAFVAKLNKLYLDTPALWKDNFSWDGFKWIDANNNSQSIVSFMRIDPETENLSVCIFNMTPMDYPSYRIGVGEYGIYREVLSSDDDRFGGDGWANLGDIMSEDIPMHGLEQSVSIHIPPVTGIILNLEKKLSKPKPVKEEDKEETKTVKETKEEKEKIKKQ